MSVITSLMYAAGAVALLAVVLECCCRRRLRQLRDSPHIAALNGVNMNNVPYPVGAPYLVAAAAPGGTVTYPMPVALAAAQAPCDEDADCFFRSYPTPTPQTLNTSETPPPTYEQVMATERTRAALPRPG